MSTAHRQAGPRPRLLPTTHWFTRTVSQAALLWEDLLPEMVLRCQRTLKATCQRRICSGRRPDAAAGRARPRPLHGLLVPGASSISSSLELPVNSDLGTGAEPVHHPALTGFPTLSDLTGSLSKVRGPTSPPWQGLPPTDWVSGDTQSPNSTQTESRVKKKNRKHLDPAVQYSFLQT